MENISAEKVRKYQMHNKKGYQRREHTPEHAEVGALVFFLQVALYKLCEEKVIGFDIFKHCLRCEPQSSPPFLILLNYYITYNILKSIVS